MLKPARPPVCLPLHPPPSPPSCAHHCQCTISSLFIGPARNDPPLIIARDAANAYARAITSSPGRRRHRQKRQGCRCVNKLNHSWHGGGWKREGEASIEHRRVCRRRWRSISSHYVLNRCMLSPDISPNSSSRMRIGCLRLQIGMRHE